MSQIEKLIEKMRNQPNGIRTEEADRVLGAFGYRLDRQRGSHMHYINDFGDVITIPNKTPIKAVYVKDILRRIEDRGEYNED
ncbi:MAG: type II toxin-antitoxin system HicA family toxin [Alphaproteobacteria bacterium]|nr:type II toxin-antitoxin system HicA family toxin [Alphaproteobacteria bacterium]